MSLKNFVQNDNKANTHNVENKNKYENNINNDILNNLKNNPNYEESNKKAQNLYNEYKDYSQDDLTNELHKQVLNAKQNGTFNYQKIKSTIELMMPYVSENQRRNLNNLLEKIK